MIGLEGAARRPLVFAAIALILITGSIGLYWGASRSTVPVEFDAVIAVPTGGTVGLDADLQPSDDGRYVVFSNNERTALYFYQRGSAPLAERLEGIVSPSTGRTKAVLTHIAMMDHRQRAIGDGSRARFVALEQFDPCTLARLESEMVSTMLAHENIVDALAR